MKTITKRLLTLIFSSLCLNVSLCEANNNIDSLIQKMANIKRNPSLYIGISGQGPNLDLGFFGHIFLLHTPDDELFTNSTAYSYAPEFAEGEPPSVEALDTAPFRARKGDGWSIINHYSNEGKYVHLFKLSLSKNDIDNIVKYIENDLLERTRKDYTDYSPTSNNCATKVYDAINTILGYKAFKYKPIDRSLWITAFMNAEGASMTFPLVAASRLETHALIGKVVKFRSEKMRRFEDHLLPQAKNIESLVSKCKPKTKSSEELKASLIAMISNKTITKKPGYIVLFSQLFEDCARNNTLVEKHYNSHIDYLLIKAENLDQAARVNSYKIK